MHAWLHDAQALTIEDAVAILIKHVQLLLHLVGHAQVCSWAGTEK